MLNWPVVVRFYLFIALVQKVFSQRGFIVAYKNLGS